MAPKGGNKIKAHFDRAEAEDPDAEAGPNCLSAASFWPAAPQCSSEGIRRWRTGQTGAFSFVTFLWSKQRKVRLSMNKTCGIKSPFILPESLKATRLKISPLANLRPPMKVLGFKMK